MNKSIQFMTKLIAFPMIIVIALLAGCSPTNQVPVSIPVTAGTAITPTTLCHATGNPENPYEKILVNPAELAVHVEHASDIIPAPVGGCPTSDVVINDGTILVCHATDSKTNPYEEITISLNGLNGHGDHEGDVFPASKGGCPLTPVVMSTGDGKITICHATNSKNNPYNLITISVNGLNGHNKHEGDIIPAPSGGCPTDTGKK
jgi:hypothetical protein